MKIAVPREKHAREHRVPVVPSGVEKLTKVEAEVRVETGLGQSIGHSDKDYRDAGAEVVDDRAALLREADMVLRLRKPPAEEIELLKEQAIHISYLDPFNEGPLLEKLAEQNVTAICMEMIPRTTRAQKMDALSSQANLAGYVAVIVAARSMAKVFPMMTTPAGTIAPVRVFIIGAGVAGLQAIATAKRLGAIVEAYDTRPAVEEQVRSLGGRFVKLDIGETGETEQGYARELSEEQLQRQREEMAKHCAKADVVITTAQLFGRPAPRIVTEEMIAGMKAGSVVIDLAVESGGNVAGSRPDEVVDVEGVRIVGLLNLPGEVAVDASLVYSNNLTGLVTEYWDSESNSFRLDLEDEILKGCVLTHQGRICHELFAGD